MSTVEIRLPGLVALEHTFEIPLDHSAPEGATIDVFARELADPEGREKPFLVYLQVARSACNRRSVDTRQLA